MLHPASGTAIPRSLISVGLDPILRGSFASRALGRALVIDYFASQGCGVVTGDLTCEFRPTPPGPGYAEMPAIEGVRLFVEPRLLAILDDAGPSLRLGGPPFARHLALELDRPERWIEFLEGTEVMVGKQGFRFRRGRRAGSRAGRS